MSVPEPLSLNDHILLRDQHPFLTVLDVVSSLAEATRAYHLILAKCRRAPTISPRRCTTSESSYECSTPDLLRSHHYSGGRDTKRKWNCTLNFICTTTTPATETCYARGGGWHRGFDALHTGKMPGPRRGDARGSFTGTRLWSSGLQGMLLRKLLHVRP